MVYLGLCDLQQRRAAVANRILRSVVKMKHVIFHFQQSCFKKSKITLLCQDI